MLDEIYYINHFGLNEKYDNLFERPYVINNQVEDVILIIVLINN